MGLSKEHRLCFTPTHTQWMRDNVGKIEDYLNSNVDYYSIEYVREMFNANPWICSVVVQDYDENCINIDTHRVKMENFMLEEGNEVTIISGSRGSGKTYEGISTIENISERTGLVNKVYIGAPNKELEAHKWEIISCIDQMQKDDFGLQDEAALFLNSRRSQSSYNVDILENLPTLRHIGARGWMVLTQSTKRMDISVLDFSNTHIIKNYTDAYSMDVERGMITNDLLLEFMMPRENYVVKSSVKSWSYVKTNEFICLKHTPVLYWYDDKVGKAFNRFDDEEQAKMFAVTMFQNSDYDVTYMTKYMKVRGMDRPKEYWIALKDKVGSGNCDMGQSKRIGEEFKSVKPLLEESNEANEYYMKLLKKKEKK